MRDEEIDSVGPSLAALFEAERGGKGAPPGASARALARLERSIGGPDGGDEGGSGPDGASSDGLIARVGTSKGASLATVFGALVVGTMAGAAVFATAAPPRIVYVDRESSRTEPATVARESAPAERSHPDELDASAAGPVAVPRAARPASSVAPRASTDTALAAERAVLDVARTALGRSDGAHALEAADRHARAFPHGQLTEEREALAVQALSRLGRHEDAALRGGRFRQRYPDSVLMPVVDAALGVSSTKTP